MISDLNELRKAIEEDRIVPGFQAITALRSGKLTGFELLSRWQHPAFGPILPENFIPLAEQHGLIWELTRQVLRKGFAAARVIADPLLLSINVSPIQLRDSSLVKTLRDLADVGGFPLNRLMIEITESAMCTDLLRAQVVARDLKAMGCRLALDDFGTGYSSLAQLQVLPFDELKIDRIFVSAMMKSRESRKIVASIIGLGHSLGLTTVAEGVETEAQADMLIWLGCEQVQGWLYGKAVPIAEVQELIAAPPRPISPAMVSPGEGWASSNLEALPTQRLSQLQAIYDGAPVGLCFLDRNFRYISLNPRLAEINDIPLADHIGKTVAEVLPELFPRIEAALVAVLNGESLPETDIAIPAKVPGDSPKMLRATFYPAFDEADEVIGISIAVLDLTSEAESAARHSEEATLVAQAAELTHAVEALTQTVQTSSQWASGPGDIKYRVGDLEGMWKWMQSRGRPRFAPTGEVVRWYGSVQEIHDLKIEADSRMPAHS